MYTKALKIRSGFSPSELRAFLCGQMITADTGGQLFLRVTYTRGSRLYNVSNRAEFLRQEALFRDLVRHHEMGLPIRRSYELVPPPVTEGAVVYINEDGLSEFTVGNWIDENAAYANFYAARKMAGHDDLTALKIWKNRFVNIIGEKKIEAAE